MHRPYGGEWIRDRADEDDAVEVIWHDDEGVEKDGRMVVGDCGPACVCDCSKIVQEDVAVDDIAEQRQALMGADGDEVGVSRGVVEARVAGRAAAVVGGIVGHRGGLAGMKADQCVENVQ